MIHLYVFCSKLEKHFLSGLTLELSTWNFPADMETLQNCMWHSPDHSRKHPQRETGESVNRSVGGGGGSNNGPMEVDGVDDDWHMNIMKWRDEVVRTGRKTGLFLKRTTFWMWLQAGYNLKGELSLLCHKPFLGVASPVAYIPPPSWLLSVSTCLSSVIRLPCSCFGLCVHPPP